MWNARNKATFQEEHLTHSQDFYMIKFSYEELELPSEPRKHRQVQEVSIDKSKAWGFFDGASKGNPDLCGAGELPFIGNHWISFEGGLAWVKAAIIG